MALRTQQSCVLTLELLFLFCSVSVSGKHWSWLFLKQPAAKLEPVIVAFYKERLIPAAGAFHWSWHQLKKFERQGMTYELLLEIFSMEKLNSLLYCNCSVNFFIELLNFTLLPELTWVGMLDFFRCTLQSVVNHAIVWDRNHTKRGEYFLSIKSAEWPLQSGLLNSVVAVFSGGVVIVLNFCNLGFWS